MSASNVQNVFSEMRFSVIASCCQKGALEEEFKSFKLNSLEKCIKIFELSKAEEPSRTVEN